MFCQTRFNLFFALFDSALLLFWFVKYKLNISLICQLALFLHFSHLLCLYILLASTLVDECFVAD